MPGMSFQEKSGGGMDTCRLPTEVEEEEEQRRETARREARRVVAAQVFDEDGRVDVVRLAATERLAAGDAALAREAVDAGQTLLLLDMLGLTVAPQREAGMCRLPACSKPMPLQSYSSSGSGSRPYWRLGYCTPACWAEAP